MKFSIIYFGCFMHLVSGGRAFQHQAEVNRTVDRT